MIMIIIIEMIMIMIIFVINYVIAIRFTVTITCISIIINAIVVSEREVIKQVFFPITERNTFSCSLA